VIAEVRFVDEAVKELDDAVLWYEDRREGLGLAFVAALDRAIESIARQPRAAVPIARPTRPTSPNTPAAVGC
jgi:hypothetical protein